MAVHKADMEDKSMKNESENKGSENETHIQTEEEAKAAAMKQEKENQAKAKKDAPKAEDKAEGKTLHKITGTDGFDDMRSAESGLFGSNTNEDDEVVSGTGYTQKMARMVGELNDGKDRNASRVIINDGDKVEVSGKTHGGYVFVEDDVYVDSPAPGSKDSKVRTLKYTKGSMVPEAELKKTSDKE